jgi:hypothetical protein
MEILKEIEGFKETFLPYWREKKQGHQKCIDGNEPLLKVNQAKTKKSLIS